MQEPLLFIPTTPFYFIEVEPELEEKPFLEESTSLYEISRPERIENPVIARQLHFFSQPVNSHRLLTMHLKNGETYQGYIQTVESINIKLKVKDQIQIINANDVEAIS
jgi:hypothetical protein